MTTPQRSRYPRPLKAMHAFAGGPGQAQGGGQAAVQGPSPSSGAVNSSTTAAGGGVSSVGGSNGITAAGGGSNSPPPSGNAVRRCQSSPEGKGIVSRGEGVGEGGSSDAGLNPRRSNSLGSLSDPDCYMKSLWPKAASSTNQCEGEETLTSTDTEFDFFSHKRSNSCSGDDRLKINKAGGMKGGVVTAAHTRKSVEGLNQEVSSVLEGNPILLVEATPPDGHVAPVQDLLGHASIGTQTPPFSVGGPVAALPSSSAPSSLPCPSPSSPASTTTSACTHIPTNTEAIHSGSNGSTRESPASFQHPPSPKPSFAREPPDGAERCTIKLETSFHMEGFIPTGPDKSKGTIIFKGTAFAPPLATPPQNLQSVP